MGVPPTWSSHWLHFYSRRRRTRNKYNSLSRPHPPCFYVTCTSWPLPRPGSGLAPILFRILSFCLSSFCLIPTPRHCDVWLCFCLVESATKIDNFEFAWMCTKMAGGVCVCVVFFLSFFLGWRLPNDISLYLTQDEEDWLGTRPAIAQPRLSWNPFDCVFCFVLCCHWHDHQQGPGGGTVAVTVTRTHGTVR